MPSDSAARAVGQGAAFVVVLGVLLFASAGRLDWWAAWYFLAFYLLSLIAIALWGLRTDPELLAERSRQAANVKHWDAVLLRIYGIVLLALPVVAGLDVQRFHWSPLPLALQVVGAVALVPALLLPWWAMAANHYLSRYVRIQQERGQTVVTRGPYRFVRHPMYVGVILLALSIPLVLGSAWALIPGAVIGAIFVLRTALEDRTLRRELPGYADYAARVRYRLLPSVW